MATKSYREEGFFEGLWRYLPSVLKVLSGAALLIVIFNFAAGILGEVEENFDNFALVEGSALQREYNYQVGNAESNVTYVIFDDYQCPACRQFNPTKSEIIAEYGDRVSIVRKHNPLRDIHVQAPSAARAVEAANIQGQFSEFGDAIFADQEQIGTRLYEDIARSLPLDFEQWERDKDSREVTRRVEQDQEDLENLFLDESSVNGRTKAVGVGAGTPTHVVLLDGEFYDWWTGAVTVEQAGSILENALSGVERDLEN